MEESNYTDGLQDVHTRSINQAKPTFPWTSCIIYVISAYPILTTSSETSSTYTFFFSATLPYYTVNFFTCSLSFLYFFCLFWFFRLRCFYRLCVFPLTHLCSIAPSLLFPPPPSPTLLPLIAHFASSVLSPLLETLALFAWLWAWNTCDFHGNLTPGNASKDRGKNHLISVGF